jgi:hypothetical protein
MRKSSRRAATPTDQSRPASVSRTSPSHALNAPALLKELSLAAERYMNKAPKQQRLAADRQALVDVLTRAQLYLSVEQAADRHL